MRFIRRGTAILAAMLIAALALLQPKTAMAAGPVNTAADCSLTITSYYGTENKVIPYMHFRIYRIADIAANGAITLVAPATNYAVPLDQQSTDSWKAFAETIGNYFRADNVPFTREGTTGPDGIYNFEHLRTGIYLILGDEVTFENRIYTPETYLLSIPQTDVNDEWQYNLVSKPKISVREIPPTTISRRVIKQWAGSSADPARPASVTVQLLCDGVVYDTQTLSASNGWSYTWTGLDGARTWAVIETVVPANYAVRISQEGVTYVITNTYNPPPPPPGNPPPGNPPPNEPPEVPEVMGARRTGLGEVPEVLGARRLPQTGMLLWPVPMIFVIGVLLFLNGLYLYRKGK